MFLKSEISASSVVHPIIGKSGIGAYLDNANPGERPFAPVAIKLPSLILTLVSFLPLVRKRAYKS